MNKSRISIGLALLFAVVFLCACSTKKNTARSRFWQAFTTRYNVYYNGKTNYDEQLKTMMDSYEDDYSQHLFIHPSEARSNAKAPQPSGSFDRTIEKMQKAIGLHSIKKKPKRQAGKGNDPKYKEWLSRSEYNPFLHNAWFMLAKAQYMKGEFLDAAATFRYITRHFTWKEQLVQETQIWEALCYCALGWTTEADNVLNHIHISKIEDKETRSLACLAFADYYLKEHRNEEAIPYLAEAVKHVPGDLGGGGGEKVRLNFLLGQLYEEAGQKALAYQAYKRAGGNMSSTYRTKFNARIKQAAVYEGSDVASEVRSLKNMTRYDRNKQYLDQIYYAIGNLYLSHGDTLRAVNNYKLAAEKSTRNGIDKAISQLTLGGIYFNQRKYDLAQPCYAEAIPQLSEDYPNYKMLKKRSDVLDELAVYAGNVTLQDSLLRLSNMSEAEQKAVIKKIIEELKKKEKEEAENAKREAYLAEQNAKGNQNGQSGSAAAPTNYTLNTDNSWYFYNTATKNAGKTAFQQQWGNRKLEDDWRRRNKQTFSLQDDEDEMQGDSTVVTAEGDTTVMDKEALKRSEDPHYEEYYLKQIPKTEEQKQAAHDIIQEGLYNMGIILKDKLEDYDAAAYEFHELLRRYPDNTYRLDVYYNMYLMYMRNNQETEANRWKDRILADFADSKYGQALKDPNYMINLKNMVVDQERMYEEAYANYLANNNAAVHAAYAEMMRKYPLSKIMPKFMFIDALSYLTQKNYDKFKEVLKDMLQRYPETDITPTASGIVKQINAGRRLEGGGRNARGLLWTTRLSNDTTTEALEKQFTAFDSAADKPHVFILLYPIDSVSSNQLLYEVARHNFSIFRVKDYDLEQMNFGRLGLLVVKGFADFDETARYRTLFEQDQSLDIPPSVHYVIISDDNFNLLLNEGRSFEDYFNYLEEKNDKEHADIENPKEEPEDDAAIEQANAEAAEIARRRAAEVARQQAEEQARIEAEEAEQRAREDEAFRQIEEIERQQAEEKARQEAEEKARQEAEEKARKEAEEKARQEEDARRRREITPSDYRSRDSQDAQQPDLINSKPDKAEQEHLKQMEREAKAREKAEQKRLKAEQDSINKVEKAREKEFRRLEKQRQDSLDNALREREEYLANRQKMKEDSVKNVYQQKIDAQKQAKKEKEEARKAKAKERKEKMKQREQERKERAKAREQERKQREKERKEAAKQREQERKAKAKAREQERKERAKQREQERKEAAKQRNQDRKERRKSGSSSNSSTQPTKSTKETTKE